MVSKSIVLGSSPSALVTGRGYMEEEFVKISKKDANDNDPIVITDAIKISALQNQVKYWKTRYDLLMKYGDTSVKFMDISN